jgi:integrase
MAGSIRPLQPAKDGRPRWELRVAGGWDPQRLRYRQVSRTVVGSRREASSALARLATEVDDGKHLGGDATVAELFTRWLALIEDHRSPTTLREYRNKIRLHLNPALGHVRVSKLTSAQIDDLYTGLRQRKGLSASSIRQVHAVLRRALEQARKWGWLERNPATLASPPSVHHKRTVVPSPADWQRLVEACSGDHDFATMVRLAAATGARRGELCALRWPDVDLRTGLVWIRRSLVVGQDLELVEKPTKTHAERRFTLDAGTIRELEAHHRRMEERALTCDATTDADGFVFSHEPDCSRPWRPDFVTATFTRLRRLANVPGVRFHDLRHLHASYLIDAGIPVSTVAQRLGHAQTSTTHNIYVHALEARDAVAAGLMGDILDGTKRGEPAG